MRHMTGCSVSSSGVGATTFEVTEDANSPTTKYRDLGGGLRIALRFARDIGNCATSRLTTSNPHGEPTLLRPMSTKMAIKERRSIRLSD